MPLTFFLAQLFGLICIALGLFVLCRKRTFIEVIHDVEKNAPLIFALGLISVVLGLITVLLHNYWYGGLLTILITLIGWIMLIRGLLAMFLPQRVVLQFIKWTRVEKMSAIYGFIVLVIGLYLAYEGFFAFTMMMHGGMW